MESTEADSSAVSAAGVAGGSFLTLLRMPTTVLLSSLGPREATDPLRVLGRDAELACRAARSFAAVRRGFLSRFWTDGIEEGSLDGGEEGRGDGARSLMGLISSRLGRVGDLIVFTEARSIFFHLVEDAEVTIGDGLGGRGLPEPVIGVCCADARYDGGPKAAGRGVCGY